MDTREEVKFRQREILCHAKRLRVTEEENTETEVFNVIQKRPIVPSLPKKYDEGKLQEQNWENLDLSWVETETTIKIQTKHFAEGNLSCAFKAITETGIRVVIKISKRDFQDTNERLVEGTYAYFLAQHYRRQLFLNDINIAPLFFSPVIKFEIADGKKF